MSQVVTFPGLLDQPLHRSPANCLRGILDETEIEYLARCADAQGVTIHEVLSFIVRNDALSQRQVLSQDGKLLGNFRG